MTQRKNTFRTRRGHTRTMPAAARASCSGSWIRKRVRARVVPSVFPTATPRGPENPARTECRFRTSPKSECPGATRPVRQREPGATGHHATGRARVHVVRKPGRSGNRSDRTGCEARWCLPGTRGPGTRRRPGAHALLLWTCYVGRRTIVMAWRMRTHISPLVRNAARKTKYRGAGFACSPQRSAFSFQLRLRRRRTCGLRSSRLLTGPGLPKAKSWRKA
jgi:hypothetical protein